MDSGFKFSSTLFRAVISWIPLTVLAIFNGTIWQSALAPFMNDHFAGALLCITLILIVTAYTGILWFIYPGWKKNGVWTTGVIWVTLTIALEFAVIITNSQPWDMLFYRYNLFAGRLWLLVVVWIAVAPKMVSLWATRLRVSRAGNA